jgi:hypothetical protein
MLEVAEEMSTNDSPMYWRRCRELNQADILNELDDASCR